MDDLIFPTDYRQKHSKAVSFPIGAEALSRVLSDVPQAKFISCSFYAQSQARSRRDEYPILSVGYRKRPLSFHDSARAYELGVLDPKWDISVYAVPVDLRHKVKLLLINEALPNTVLRWLQTWSHLGQQTGQRGVFLTYVVASETIRAEETGDLDPERIGG